MSEHRNMRVATYHGNDPDAIQIIAYQVERIIELQNQVDALQGMLMGLVNQIEEFAGKHGEADFYTGAAIKLLPNHPLHESLTKERSIQMLKTILLDEEQINRNYLADE